MLKVSARIFPIGYIISVDNPDFDPHDFYIDGVWERIKGRVVVGVDENQTEFNETGKFGGEKTHTLTVSEMPEHRHYLTIATPMESSGTGYFGARIYEGYATEPTHNANGLGTINRGGDQPHNNLQPYYVAYIWKLVSYSN